ncbi:MAG TPA: hypothetical protein PLP19_20700 [bacterium]|nr:hypothetical protein [bacterium]HPN45916.1 hypothetical protein [bacterium]
MKKRYSLITFLKNTIIQLTGTLAPVLFFFSIGLLAVFFGCQKNNTPETSGRISAQTDSLRAAALFTALEDSLLAGRTFNAAFDITSQGAIVSSLQGRVALTAAQVDTIIAVGSFSGKEVHLTLKSDGSTMQYGHQNSLNTLPAPLKLNEGILIGFTRMGLLHNLAMLAFGEPPDKTDGAVRQWVTCSGFRFAPDDANHPGTGIFFQIYMNNKPVGEATLWLNSQSGLPARRVQTVHFDDGDMQVEEIYSELNLQPGK